LLAALPYPAIPSIPLWGDERLHAFDVLVALAVVAGALVAERRAQRMGLDRRVIVDVVLWAVIPGFIGSHLYSVLAYFPERVAADPWVLLNLFAGMSSFGGFVGGALGVIYFFRRRRLDLWSYSDPIAYGFTFAWIFGRLGCTVAFDHPGHLTDFFLAMPYPGTAALPAGLRHNLGFYEFLWAVALFAFLFSQRRRRHYPGWTVVVFLLTYVPVRFAFDFLREVDRRYAGLTPGQWAALGLGTVGLYLAARLPRRARALASQPPATAAPGATPPPS